MGSSRSIRSALRRLRALPREDRAVAIRALALAPAVALALRALGLRRVRAALGRASATARGTAPSPERASRIAALVERAAARAPLAGGCLARALVVWTLLRREGIAAELRLGVRRPPRGLEAHAWVDAGGRTLDPGPAVWRALPPLPPAAGRPSA